jgi:lipid-A-disaccharide synthase-like uncharacterized protein
MNLDDTPIAWLILGLGGQALFSCRFLIQWIASERRKQSVVPRTFWWFSIGGGLCLLTYATLKQDPVFMLGQSAGLIVYLRNIILLRKEQPTAGGAAG